MPGPSTVKLCYPLCLYLFTSGRFLETSTSCINFGFGSNPVKALELPDPNDLHVLAVAIKGGAHIIVTENKKDFPEEILSPFDIEIQSADEFLLSTLDLYPSRCRGGNQSDAETPQEAAS